MSLGLLVGRFGTFVRETHNSTAISEPEEAFPARLNHLRESVGHHLIPLVLIARSDREFLDCEQAVIVSHCLAVAGRQGIEPDGSELALLNDYVAGFRPALLQLDLALSRLAHGGAEEFAELVEAARAVVEADGVVAPEEMKLLSELREDLAALAAKS